MSARWLIADFFLRMSDETCHRRRGCISELVMVVSRCQIYGMAPATMLAAELAAIMFAKI